MFSDRAMLLLSKLFLIYKVHLKLYFAKKKSYGTGFYVKVWMLYNAVVTPLRKAASYEQRKTNLGSSP